NQFVKNRFGSSDKIASVTNSLLENDETVDILGVGIISFFIDKIVNNSLGTDFTYLDFIGDEGKVANGFSEKIIQFQENRSKLN
ncbi:TPA: peptidoglycan-binding protein, partial [Enterococcus faecium]|nr:peptidoglycan-binding protein [Enterococcus faecium]